MDSNDIDRQLCGKLNESVQTLTKKRYVLDTRDKLLRLGQERQTDLAKAVAFVGTCPDMCPERERYFRIQTNQVQVFELGQDGTPDETRMVKEYRRSGADQEEPLPNELRPIEVLERTMEYLCLQIVDQYKKYSTVTGWFDFIWNRTRAIRKDLTQQHLIDLRSVTLVEQCARFHIFCAYYQCEEDTNNCDPKMNEENLKNCLQTLKDFYDDLNLRNIECPNEPEFRAYDFLLDLCYNETLVEAKNLKKNVIKSPQFTMALDLYHSYNNRNYIRFFRLARRADFFQSCILNRYFNMLRISAINTMVKTYTVPKSSNPFPFPIKEIIDQLAFDNFEELSQFCECVGLIYDNKAVFLHRNFSIDQTNITNRSKNLVMDKLKTTPGQAILGYDKGLPNNNTGQIMPVHSSFDQNDRLIYDKNLLNVRNVKSKESILKDLMTLLNDNNKNDTKEILEKPPPVPAPTTKSSAQFGSLASTFSFKEIAKGLTKPEEKRTFFQDPRSQQQQQQNEQENVFAKFSFKLPAATTIVQKPVNEFAKPFEKLPPPPPPPPVPNYKKAISECKTIIFDSILNEVIRRDCGEIIKSVIEEFIRIESLRIFDDILGVIIKETVQNLFYNQQKRKRFISILSKELSNLMLTLAIKSTIAEWFSDFKIKHKRKKLLSFSEDFFEESFEEIVFNLISEIYATEILRRDRFLENMRRNFLQRKYWSKWRVFFYSRKKLKYHRDTFPAAPAIKMARLGESSSNNNRLRMTIIDDEFIKMNDSLKRKLVYSQYTDPEEMNRYIERNLKNLSINNKPSQMDQMIHYDWLAKKYFKKWLNKTRHLKKLRLSREFPATPNVGGNCGHDRPSPLTSWTVIDSTIVNANENIKTKLLKRLNYDFDSTVQMANRTLENFRMKRQQLRPSSLNGKHD